MFLSRFDQFPRKKNSLVLLVIFKNIWLNVSDKRQCITVNLPLAQKFCRPILSVLEAQACTGREQLSAMQKSN